ncbi:hypothetical protein AB1Y20_005179 [Prymnesium parvum]|uniref:Uncharacterized protein n=1 Tax=Prymnesium parvum TaxID=97485 RepID=A0AB34J6H4_PRYPA
MGSKRARQKQRNQKKHLDGQGTSELDAGTSAAQEEEVQQAGEEEQELVEENNMGTDTVVVDNLEEGGGGEEDDGEESKEENDEDDTNHDEESGEEEEEEEDGSLYEDSDDDYLALTSMSDLTVDLSGMLEECKVKTNADLFHGMLYDGVFTYDHLDTLLMIYEKKSSKDELPSRSVLAKREKIWEYMNLENYGIGLSRGHLGPQGTGR